MTFTVTIIESGDSIWMFNSTNFGANIAFDAGLTFTENVPTPEETPDRGAAVQISLEQLPLIDADHIFLFTNWNSGAEKELFANPVWQSFAASNPERIHYLTGEYWVREHPYSAHRVIDDLFRYVAKVEPADVSPNPFAYTYPQPDIEATNEE
jgi:ABC-type Fe3+-hydroxamate transport system substrate-binding protein